MSSYLQRALITAAVLAVVFVIGASLIDRGLCSYYGYQTDRQVCYAAFVGCMVKTPAGWIPRSELRVVQ